MCTAVKDATGSKFAMGGLYMTPGVQGDVPEHEMLGAITRHSSGDWGDCNAADKAANDEALKYGDRLFSVYLTKGGVKFWIITEAEDDSGVRSHTTVLLPEEY